MILLPDGTKRSKTFKTLRAAKLFDGEVRSARHDGETIDPRIGKTELHMVWLASRPDPELGRPTLRVHDLRHTNAQLARSAGADK